MLVKKKTKQLFHTNKNLHSVIMYGTSDISRTSNMLKKLYSRHDTYYEDFSLTSVLKRCNNGICTHIWIKVAINLLVSKCPNTISQCSFEPPGRISTEYTNWKLDCIFYTPISVCGFDRISKLLDSAKIVADSAID